MIVGGDGLPRIICTHIGSDIAVFKGIAKAVIERRAVASDFLLQHTEDYQAFIADIPLLLV